LNPGTYTVQIDNVWDLSKFQAGKYFELHSVTALGGSEQLYLGIFLIVISLIILLIIAALIVLECTIGA